MNTYTIKIDRFEGPFDLLLFFIERDELEINDIPIAKITDDFLAYIKALENLNIDVASEFILVAATLMRIKAKMLIPRKEVDEQGNEIDPREELAQKLLEYKKFKEVVEQFEDMESIRLTMHHRGDVATELKVIANKALVDLELESLSLYRLLMTFKRVMERFDHDQNKPVHKIVQYAYTIEDQQNIIRNKISFGKKVDFIELFSEVTNRIQALVTFLALLEMLNLQQIKIIQGEGINNFWIHEVDEVDEVVDASKEEE